MALVYLLPSGDFATTLGGTDNGLFVLDQAIGRLDRGVGKVLTPGSTYNVVYIVFDTVSGIGSVKRDTITAGPYDASISNFYATQFFSPVG